MLWRSEPLHQCTITERDEDFRDRDQGEDDHEADGDLFQRVPFRVTALWAHLGVANRCAAFCARTHKCLRSARTYLPNRSNARERTHPVREWNPKTT